MKKLTYRQNEILKLLSIGKTNKEISVVLNIKKRTVEVHIYRLYKSLNVKNRTSAAFIYSQNKKFFNQS